MEKKNPTSPIASPSVTQAILDSHGLSAKKSFAQNFLINDAIIRKICDLADVTKEDKIIEIGPGLGTLTLALLLKGAKVLAIEKDKDMAEILRENAKKYCPNNLKNLEIYEGDALKVDKNIIEAFAKDSSLKMVANLPYNIAAPLVITYFQNFECMAQACVMVQKEIADRMLADPGNKNYGAYTVKLSMYAQACGKFKVSPNNFIPAPRVDSTVIKLERKTCADQNLSKIACEIADAAFAHRRKTIANSVKQYFSNKSVSANVILKIFEDLNISLTDRAEVLSKEQYVDIAKNLQVYIKNYNN